MEQIIFEDIREKFKGTHFYELINHHLKKQDMNQLIAALSGTIKGLPDEVQPLTEEFIDRWNAKAYELDFWQKDTALVFDEIVDDAYKFLKEYGQGRNVTNNSLFDMFQIIVLNFAYSACDQPKMKTFIGINESVKMPIYKKIVIAYSVVIFAICMYAPWIVSEKAITSGRATMRDTQGSYSFIWDPPKGAVSIDLKRMSIEFFGATIIAGVLYWSNRRKD